MKSAYFDEFADVYDAVAPDRYYIEATVRDLAREYEHHRCLAPERIMDLGGGVGRAVPALQRHFPGAHITLLDVSEASLELACRRYPGIWAIHYDGAHIPFESGSFDLVFASGVFHHAQPSYQYAMLGQARRVLAPGGLLAIFEHNPFNPITRAMVRSCPFDEGAELIRPEVLRARAERVGFESPRVQYRRFIPRALRWLSPIERYLEWCPLGAQYSVMATR